MVLDARDADGHFSGPGFESTVNSTPEFLAHFDKATMLLLGGGENLLEVAKQVNLSPEIAGVAGWGAAGGLQAAMGSLARRGPVGMAIAVILTMDLEDDLYLCFDTIGISSAAAYAWLSGGALLTGPVGGPMGALLRRHHLVAIAGSHTLAELEKLIALAGGSDMWELLLRYGDTAPTGGYTLVQGCLAEGSAWSVIGNNGWGLDKLLPSTLGKMAAARSGTATAAVAHAVRTRHDAGQEIPIPTPGAAISPRAPFDLLHGTQGQGLDELISAMAISELSDGGSMPTAMAGALSRLQ